MPTLTKTTTLFSLAALKDWIRITAGASANTEDSRLVIAADAASEEIESETDHVFVTRSLTVTANGSGRSGMFLPPARPILSVTSLTVDGALQDPSGYGFEADTGILQFTGGGCFSTGVRNVVLVASVGYDVQDGLNLPRDVYRAGLDLAKAIYDELATGAIAASSVSLGASTMVIKAAKRPPSVQRVIDRWQDYYIA